MITFAKALEALQKDQPGVSAVHVATALGNGKSRKARSFKDVLGKSDAPGASADPLMNRTGLRTAGLSSLPAVGAGTDANIAADGPMTKGDQPRALKPIDGQNSHVPFPYDAAFLGSLREDQVPRFYGALTAQDRQEDRTVPVDSLVATQNRVETGKVEGMRGGKRPGKPLVVRHQGRNYIADGHHGAAAAWLDGADAIDVKFKDLEPVDQALKRAPPAAWDVPFTLTKADPDQRLVFGWASIAKVDDKWVVDKQGDAIPVDELEKAAYEFVLKFRENDDMHVGGPTGRCIESMVFTPEKAALGLVAKDEQGREVTGWWTGFYIDDDALWKAHKEGRRPEFSIGGSGVREEITDADLA